MPKTNQPKKKRRNVKNTTRTISQNKNQRRSPKPKRTFSHLFNTVISKVLIVLGLIGAYTTYKTIKGYFDEEDRKSRQTDTESNELLAPPLALHSNKVVVQLGHNFEPVDMNLLRQGQVPLNNINLGNITFADDIKLQVINDRLYISTTFTNYDGKTIGQIENNRWTFYHSKDLQSGFDANSFEIVDKDKNVLMNVRFINSETVQFMGYKVRGDNVFVFNESGLKVFVKGKSNPNDIMAAIKSTKHLFNY